MGAGAGAAGGSLRGGLGGVAQVEHLKHRDEQGAFYIGVNGAAAGGGFVELGPDGFLVGVVEQGVARHVGVHGRAEHFAVEPSADV